MCGPYVGYLRTNEACSGGIEACNDVGVVSVFDVDYVAGSELDLGVGKKALPSRLDFPRDAGGEVVGHGDVGSFEESDACFSSVNDDESVDEVVFHEVSEWVEDECLVAAVDAYVEWFWWFYGEEL